MTNAFLTADIQLPPLQWQNVFTLNLEPGVWDILFSPEVEVAQATLLEYQIEARIWDGESTFYGGGTVAQGPETLLSTPLDVAAHASIAGGADLSLQVVPTNVFAQLLYTPKNSGANAFVKARSVLNNLFAATWIFAQPDQGSGSLGATDHQLLLDLHQALAAQSYGSFVQHTGLTGNGTITVSWPDSAIRVSVTAVPPGGAVDIGSPDYHFDLGFITLSNANGFVKSQRLVFLNQTYVLPAGAGQVGYTLRPGVSIDIAVLQSLT